MIRIEAEALQRLLVLRQQLTTPCAGLRIQLHGDSCQGWRVSIAWSGALRQEDYAVDYQGLVLIAAIAHWPYLQGAVVQAGSQGERQGLWVELQATACHCDNQVCGASQSVRCE